MLCVKDTTGAVCEDFFALVYSKSADHSVPRNVKCLLEIIPSNDAFGAGQRLVSTNVPVLVC